MSRIIQDQGLQLWEAYASSGDHGYPERARVLFQCLTDTGRRARVAVRESSRAEVEREIATASEAELLALLSEAEELR